MAVRQALLLRNPQLCQVSGMVRKTELGDIEPLIEDLHDTLMDFRKRFDLN